VASEVSLTPAALLHMQFCKRCTVHGEDLYKEQLTIAFAPSFVHRHYPKAVHMLPHGVTWSDMCSCHMALTLTQIT
jgi:hypothetical protein